MHSADTRKKLSKLLLARLLSAGKMQTIAPQDYASLNDAMAELDTFVGIRVAFAFMSLIGIRINREQWYDPAVQNLSLELMQSN